MGRKVRRLGKSPVLVRGKVGGTRSGRRTVLELEPRAGAGKQVRGQKGGGAGGGDRKVNQHAGTEV